MVVDEVLEMTFAVIGARSMGPPFRNVRLFAVASVAAWDNVSDVADSTDATYVPAGIPVPDTRSPGAMPDVVYEPDVVSVVLEAVVVVRATSAPRTPPKEMTPSVTPVASQVPYFTVHPPTHLVPVSVNVKAV